MTTQIVMSLSLLQNYDFPLSTVDFHFFQGLTVAEEAIIEALLTMESFRMNIQQMFRLKYKATRLYKQLSGNTQVPF